MRLPEGEYDRISALLVASSVDSTGASRGAGDGPAEDQKIHFLQKKNYCVTESPRAWTQKTESQVNTKEEDIQALENDSQGRVLTGTRQTCSSFRNKAWIGFPGG